MVREMGPAKACGDHVPLLHSLRLSKQRGGRIFLSKQRGSQNRESLSCKARPLGSAVSQNREALRTERCGEGELREFCLPRQGGVTVALILKTERKEERLSERRGSLEVSKQRRSLKTEMEGRKALKTGRLPLLWLLRQTPGGRPAETDVVASVGVVEDLVGSQRLEAAA